MYKQVVYWVKNYGSSGAGDQRAVQDFMECETVEIVSSLKLELANIVQGNFDQENLDKLIGAKRRLRHDSYQEWAKLMLLWIASYKA
ncbi:MAG: hypothetical protein DCC75_07620 [Proteobacteria bacterium]|nr:MAG: hypothetical protein DCC75_07620 [Pseudomonadota bacterium]